MGILTITGELPSVLEHYPLAQVVVPEHALPSVVWGHDNKINYAGKYFSEAGAHDRFQFDGFELETCRSNHNVSKRPVSDTLNAEKYLWKTESLISISCIAGFTSVRS